MTDIIAPSGAKVKIGMAPFADAMALKNAVARELAASGVKADAIDDLSGLLPALLAIDCSPAVYAAIFKCLVRCSYNGQKITENTFEDAEARGDYYDIIIACAKENLSPFFKNLASRLAQFKPPATKNPAENQP
ncbi:MAG: phage tail assembly chaperone [Candidatus Acidiferrales bacterium]